METALNAPKTTVIALKFCMPAQGDRAQLEMEFRDHRVIFNAKKLRETADFCHYFLPFLTLRAILTIKISPQWTKTTTFQQQNELKFSRKSTVLKSGHSSPSYGQ